MSNNNISYKMILSGNSMSRSLFPLILLCIIGLLEISCLGCGRSEMVILGEESVYANETGELKELSRENTADDTKVEDMGVTESKDATVTHKAEAEYSEKIQVHICGAVKNEGVYELEKGCRIIDGINAAGGFNDDACKNIVNLSQVLEDAQRIYIPTSEETDNMLLFNNEQYQVQTKEMSNNGLININTADKSMLMTLKGIGETRAEAIIEYREKNGKFSKKEDIQKVSGIGNSSYEKLKDQIYVD